MAKNSPITGITGPGSAGAQLPTLPASPLTPSKIPPFKPERPGGEPAHPANPGLPGDGFDPPPRIPGGDPPNIANPGKPNDPTPPHNPTPTPAEPPGGSGGGMTPQPPVAQPNPTPPPVVEPPKADNPHAPPTNPGTTPNPGTGNPPPRDWGSSANPPRDWGSTTAPPGLRSESSDNSKLPIGMQIAPAPQGPDAARSQLNLLLSPQPTPVEFYKAQAQAFTLNPALDKPAVDVAKLPVPKGEKGDEVRSALVGRLPPGDYKVELGEFKGWEREIPKSVLPEGGKLERAQGQHTVEIPFGNKKVVAQVHPDGTFTAVVREGHEELRGRIDNKGVVAERWDVSGQVPTKNAEWRTPLYPPFPILPPEKLERPLEIEQSVLDPALADLKLGTITSLISQPIDVYLATGRILALPPYGSAQLSTLELESPHVSALKAAKLVEVKVEE